MPRARVQCRAVADTLGERSLGAALVLFGPRGGKYPDGNSLLVRGGDQNVLIDPSLGLWPRREALPRVDRVVLSHCHEDHIAGLPLFPRVPCHVHEADRIGLLSLDDMMQIYGYAEPIGAPWRQVLEDQFHYAPRPDARGFEGDVVFELGGGVRVRAIPAPGHTRGHCLLYVEPDGALYLGDIDLSSFGPYYGDRSSSLDAFERSLAICRTIDARWYITFHHKGIVEGRDRFLALMDEYEAVVPRRERALLAMLDEPCTIDDIVARRFIYRPHVTLMFVEGVERRSAELHLERLLARGQVEEVEPGRYRRV
jgi:glyoxylase-like metal-dependent hydrolase (beta-lactamase superfamily II)